MFLAILLMQLPARCPPVSKYWHDDTPVFVVACAHELAVRAARYWFLGSNASTGDTNEYSVRVHTQSHLCRFDDVTQMLWNRAGKNRSSPTENYKTLRRRLQVALATGRKTLDEAADALETNVSSIVFVPEFKLDDKLLVG